jgi:hypothetical protein
MNYFLITRRIKRQPEIKVDFYEIYQRIALALFVCCTLGIMELTEKIFIGRVLIVWFIPILAGVIYLNLRMFKKKGGE